jgi:acyl-CoA synthetase (AMP-forming)/AMP-acid ligase II
MFSSLAALERFGAQTALIDRGRQIRYAELIARADELVAELPPRSLVFLQARNRIDAIAAYLGCLRGGHVAYLFGDAEPSQLDRLAELYRPNALFHARSSGVELTKLPHAPPPLHPDLCVLLSTSGSTGSPKLVKLSRRNVESNAHAIADYLRLTAADRAITSLDFNYAYGLSVLHSHWAVGGALVLTQASVVNAAFWADFTAGAATSFAGVPYTFELLAGQDDWAASPTLRYVTQAGGRIAPSLARRLAELGARHGWELFLMYGQTEAAPRIAYLPPDKALTHPDCIGRAIPGGVLSLVDDEMRVIEAAETPGQLRYAGPNVMMGYADRAEALTTDETPPALLTGDLAVLTTDGLYRIVGRVSRIVKPFGVRTNLDEVQEIARARLADAVTAGTDAGIVVATTLPPPADFAASLAAAIKLPAFMVQVLQLDAIPRLPSGKLDAPALLALAKLEAKPAQPAEPSSFLDRFMRELRNILGLSSGNWRSVREIYAALLERPVDGGSTFAGLAGDSLTYVQAMLALEDYLGAPPEDGWETLTVDELEARRGAQAVL